MRSVNGGNRWGGKVKGILCLILVMMLFISSAPENIYADTEARQGELTIQLLLSEDAPYGDKFRFHVTGQTTGYDFWVTLEKKGEGDILSKTISVPIDTYTVQEVMPGGYTTEEDTRVEEVLGDAGKSGIATFENIYNSSLGYFRTADYKENDAETKDIYGLEASVALELKTMDIVLVLDCSSSMLEQMDSGVTRFKAMRDSVLEFLDIFQESLNKETEKNQSRIGVVLYGDGAEAVGGQALYPANEVDRLISAVKNIPEPSKNIGTPMDMGLSLAYRLFDENDSLDYSDERYVLLFTDGLPGYSDELAMWGGAWFPTIFEGEGSVVKNRIISEMSCYYMNSYRVAAEVLNQAKVLKAAGESVEMNEFVSGSGEFGGEDPVRFYGVNADENWPNIEESRLRNSDFEVIDLRVSLESFKEIMETHEKSGNKVRSAVGMEATVYTIACVDLEELPESDASYAQELFEEVSSESTSTYYTDDFTDLKSAFEDIFNDLLRIPEACIKLNLGSGYQVLTADSIIIHGGKGETIETKIGVEAGENTVTVYLDVLYAGDEPTIIKLLLLRTSEDNIFPEDDVTVYCKDGTEVEPKQLTVSSRITA